MKRYLLTLIGILLAATTMAQMPRDFDFGDWDWEDQSPGNWERRLNAGDTDPDSIRDGWTYIPPPFAINSERRGDIVDVYTNEDYTKEKGWRLLWAQFDGIFPYFILYHPHRSLVRAFFHLEGDDAYNYVVSTLSFHRASNPSVLALGSENVKAPDSYLNGEVDGENDLLSVVIPNVSIQTWCSADFPIMYDDNLRSSRYTDKKWVFGFYGGLNYKISLVGTSTAPANKDVQQTIVGGSVSSDKFQASQAKILKNVKSFDEFLKAIKKTTDSIDSQSPKFLRTYKRDVDRLKGLQDFVGGAAGFIGQVGTIYGFFKGIFGAVGASESTESTATVSTLDIQGTIDIKKALGGNTIKVPGTPGGKFPPVVWDPYDCVLGVFNLGRTPTLSVTKSYERRGCPNGSLFTNREDYISGYTGRYKKYKLEKDIDLVINDIEGMELLDVRFGIICQPTGVGQRAYDITDPVIAQYRHWDLSGREIYANVYNPAYRELEQKRFKVHKYDKENNEIIYGTPYLKMNQLKGVSFEVPEDTQVRIRVIARFNSSFSDMPVVFQTDYGFEERQVKPAYTKLYCDKEQATFPMSDYYTAEEFIALQQVMYNTEVKARTIELRPSFDGNDGFIAEAVELYPSSGNTRLYYKDRLCFNESNGRLASEEDIDVATPELGIHVFPNPFNGRLTIQSDREQPVLGYQIFDSKGGLISEKEVNSTLIELNLNSVKKGIYFVRLVYEDRIFVRKILKQ